MQPPWCVRQAREIVQQSMLKERWYWTFIPFPYRACSRLRQLPRCAPRFLDDSNSMWLFLNFRPPLKRLPQKLARFIEAIGGGKTMIVAQEASQIEPASLNHRLSEVPLSLSSLSFSPPSLLFSFFSFFSFSSFSLLPPGGTNNMPGNCHKLGWKRISRYNFVRRNMFLRNSSGIFSQSGVPQRLVALH